MRTTLCLFFWLVRILLNAQELVRNGGFEQYTRCPRHFAAKPARGLEGVKTIGGMPGYFHACSEQLGTPMNWAGWQAPYEGEAYMGLVLTAHGGGECAVREFVQLELAEPLVNGGKYELSFRVSLADRSGYMTDRIGACFSVEDRSRKGNLAQSFGRPDVDNVLNRFIADTAGWMVVKGIYNARGGERYVQVGNFQLCDRTSRKAVTANRGSGTLQNMKRKADTDLDPDKERGLRRRLLATQAYAYVDAVSLVPLGHTEEIRVLHASDACPADPAPPPPAMDLVPDPAFDRNLPAHGAAWKNASGGTPDFLKDRAGIYLYSAVNKDHREYIQTPLKERLDPCGVYAVRLRILRDATYAYAVDRIGIALTEAFENDRRRDLLTYPVRWELRSAGVMDNASGWTTLCGTIEGGGCADRLIVGNFSSDDSTTIVQYDPQGGPFAYYFVDDVSLWRTGTMEGCTTRCPEELATTPTVLDTTAEAPRWPLALHFAVNDHVPGADLLPVAEDLFHQLTEHPGLVVLIEGHTDDTGNEEANRKLAERRAKAVWSELVRLGVEPGRMQVVVVGSQAPVATNATEQGRAQNRRVTITPRTAEP